MARVTKQREAIQSILSNSGRPLSPNEIALEAGKALDNLNLATVYRNLKLLVEKAEVQVVKMLGQPDRYEMAGLAHHHHFHCVECDRLYDIEGCPKTLEKLAPKGFEVLSHDVTLSGRCQACLV